MNKYQELVDALQQLGLQHVEPEEPLLVPELGDDQAHGQQLPVATSGQSRSDRVARAMLDQEFYHVARTETLQLKRSEDHPGLLWMRVAESAGPFTITDPASRCTQVPGDERLLLLDELVAGPPAALNLRSGLILLLLRSASGQTRLWPLRSRPAVPSPAKPETSLLQQWLPLSADGWIKDELEHRSARTEPWEEAVSVGFFFRLRDTTLDAGMARNAERSWARCWTSARLTAVEAGCWEAADQLGEKLDALWEDLQPAEPDWQHEVIKVCHLRDDLEGALLLRDEARDALGGSGSENPLSQAIAQLDEKGQDFIRSIPTWEEATADERLWRAAMVDPDGWWTEPATWSNPPDEEL